MRWSTGVTDVARNVACTKGGYIGSGFVFNSDYSAWADGNEPTPLPDLPFPNDGTVICVCREGPARAWASSSDRVVPPDRASEERRAPERDGAGLLQERLPPKQRMGRLNGRPCRT